MNKNILIVIPHSIDPNEGGIERVYWNLSPELGKRGYKVMVAYNIRSKVDETQTVYDEAFYMGDIDIESVDYTDRLDEIIRHEDVGIVIYATHGFRLFDYFSRQKQLKVFFHHHGQPRFTIYPSVFPEKLRNTWFGNIACRMNVIRHFHSVFPRIDRNNMKWVLLSEHFRDELDRVYHFKESNVLAIPNPFPNIPAPQISDKENIILYVGRVTQESKRFQNVLDIWKMVQDRLPDYRLEIVGGGPEKEYFNAKANSMQLKRYSFRGFQRPDEYYKKAKAFIMTSDKEGFGMVLVEAMQYGCVPFAFDSFASLHDIIDDRVNGFIIKPFKKSMYAETLIDFLRQPEIRFEEIACNAIKKSKNFSVDKICDKWVEAIENY